ncbi:T9SS type A sorting domain-containing protein [Aequorivita marisscotiae]|uniref:T9SS type A sorting domain-containing protein n=1 Tax=Aequorivita marisscotiae TaxID=3040348 RepID=A0ABY8KQF6_9FLAO|nr:T9SS type A sorting domain-containing protein [Aequorivita sp. Ant34-E75]WGF91696.1 T9SS type A sorting domain-containing protein [Aequorivita sp. Ant34-E75]
MTKINITKSIFILFCLFGITTAKAQFTQTAKVVSTNRESRAEYGTSVAITENFAVVGASRETIASGAAYIYSKDSQGNWMNSQRLAADDPNQGAEFGGGVKITEDYLVVAAGRADVGGTQRAGALYVYDYQNNNWEFGTKLVASDMSNDAKLGMNPTSLDAEGNTIVVGAPGENGWVGSVYVFTKVAGNWSEAQKILSPTAPASDTFGIGVSISGDYLVIGANEVDGRKGAAYVYLKNSNGTWEYNQTLMASDAANDNFFGTSVSLSGDQLVVGAYGSNLEQGAAYVFEKDNQGAWVEVQKLNGNASTEGTQYGWSTDIQRDYIVVSAPHIFGLEAGEVYFYKRESSGTWVEDQVIQGSDTVAEDFYGWSVAMHENQLISGAPWEDHDENGGNEIDRAGSAYIFMNPSLLGVTDNDVLENNIAIYPNPVKDNFNIESLSKTISNLKVYSITGTLLREMKNVNANTLGLNISNYTNGVYFVNLTLDDGSTVVKKIIKH